MAELTPEALDAANLAFENMVQDRHDMGAEKYGPVKFLELDSIQMALEEVADLANYARYTFIKLWLLQYQLVFPEQKPDPLGKDAVRNPFAGG